MLREKTSSSSPSTNCNNGHHIIYYGGGAKRKESEIAISGRELHKTPLTPATLLLLADLARPFFFFVASNKKKQLPWFFRTTTSTKLKRILGVERKKGGNGCLVDRTRTTLLLLLRLNTIPYTSSLGLCVGLLTLFFIIIFLPCLFSFSHISLSLSLPPFFPLSAQFSAVFSPRTSFCIIFFRSRIIRSSPST